MTHFSAIAASFVLERRREGKGGHKNNRKLGKLGIFMSKFLGHRKKNPVQGQTSDHEVYISISDWK